MENTNKKTQPLFWTIRLLFILFLLSCHLIGGLYARYSSQASASSSSRVAKFDASADCIYDQETDKYTVTIVNNSEVSVLYTLSFKINGAAPPDGVGISFEHGNSGVLSYGASLSGVISFSENYNVYHDEILLDVVIDVTQMN